MPNSRFWPKVALRERLLSATSGHSASDCREPKTNSYNHFKNDLRLSSVHFCVLTTSDYAHQRQQELQSRGFLDVLGRK